MIINTFQPKINPTYTQAASARTTPIAFKSVAQADVCTFSNTGYFESGLFKLRKINKEEYDSLTDAEKTALRTKLRIRCPNCKEDVKLHQFAANSMKAVFDKQYGEGNYVVIPVGRSLSSIGKMLALKIGDENVKNVPLSNVDRYYTSSASFNSYKEKMQLLKDTAGIDEYQNYLGSIGLNKEEVNNSGKQYIITDLAASGDSLRAAYTVLTSDLLLGNDKGNITTASINNIVKHVEDEGNLEGTLLADLRTSRYKSYSLVNKSRYNFLNTERDADYLKFFKENKSGTEEIKLFGFALLDSEFSGLKKTSALPKVKKSSSIERMGEDIGTSWEPLEEQYHSDIQRDMQRLYYFLKKLEDLPSGRDEKWKKQLQKLTLLDAELRRYKMTSQYDIKPANVRKAYYSQARPNLQKTLSDISLQFFSEK